MIHFVLLCGIHRVSVDTYCYWIYFSSHLDLSHSPGLFLYPPFIFFSRSPFQCCDKINSKLFVTRDAHGYAAHMQTASYTQSPAHMHTRTLLNTHLHQQRARPTRLMQSMRQCKSGYEMSGEWKRGLSYMENNRSHFVSTLFNISGVLNDN